MKPYELNFLMNRKRKGTCCHCQEDATVVIVRGDTLQGMLGKGLFFISGPPVHKRFFPICEQCYAHVENRRELPEVYIKRNGFGSSTRKPNLDELDRYLNRFIPKVI